MDRERSRLEETYRRHRPRFLEWAARATRNLVEAEDLVQDAFVAAVAESDALSAVDDVAAWLFTALRNKARDLWRHREVKRRSGEVDVSQDAMAEIVAAAGLDPLSLATQSELADALYEAIEGLPEELRMVIEAQVLDGLTFEDLSEATGISPNTLAARKRRAVARLASELRDWIDVE